MAKGVDEKDDERVLRWFGHIERMKNDKIGKKGPCERVCGKSLSRSTTEEMD